jgi:uncharacterized membrane protein
MLENLYDVIESSNVNFVGCVSEESRFDFAIIYTSHFFGKPLVVCIQTGRSSPLSADDLSDTEILRTQFLLTEEEAVEFTGLLRNRLPTLEIQDQY